LQALVDNFDGDLPDYLPILGYDLLSHGPDRQRCRPAGAGFAPSSECTLPILLSKVLLAFAIEFERDSGVSLAMSSNTLRLIGQERARVRDPPRLSGVSKEAIAMSLGRLEERGLAFVQPESAGSRVKILRLTPKGRIAQDAYHRLILDVEPRWRERLGRNVVRILRELLERLDGDATAHRSPLFRGLEPYPNGWRAAAPRPEELPHYPMVLHRGGFPDGS
jgi:DNA-binding MarR family transcriptional regulator